ncbi:MAG: HalOD1 output domain-containing protein [Halorientalis sp.]
MGVKDGEVYILSPDADGDPDDEAEAWMTPRPASEVVIDRVAAAADESPDEFDDLSAYVDTADLAAVFAEDGEEDAVTFDVDDHEVTVRASGDVEIGEGD